MTRRLPIFALFAAGFMLTAAAANARAASWWCAGCPAAAAPVVTPVPAAPQVLPAPVGAPKCEANFFDDVKKDIARLLADKYHQAVHEGRLAEARFLAERALSLDPACFDPGQ